VPNPSHMLGTQAFECRVTSQLLGCEFPEPQPALPDFLRLSVIHTVKNTSVVPCKQHVTNTLVHPGISSIVPRDILVLNLLRPIKDRHPEFIHRRKMGKNRHGGCPKFLATSFGVMPSHPSSFNCSSPASITDSLVYLVFFGIFFLKLGGEIYLRTSSFYVHGIMEAKALCRINNFRYITKAI